MPFSAKIPLKDAKVQLQKSAVDTFGVAVDDFSKGVIDRVLGNEPEAAGASVNRNDPKQWYSTSYAAALASGSYRPKLKFLFKVEFIFTEEAKKEAAKFMNTDRTLKNEFTFMIKQVDRPKIDFEYEEDVNMYNFRTKVLKKIRHQDLTIVFMDDVGNRVFDFFRMLLAIHSPVSRNGYTRDNTFDLPKSDGLSLASGMTFLPGGVGKNNAHRAAVNSSFGNSIQAIRVKQIFVDPSPSGENALAMASRMVIFDFLNPRVVRFDLDDMNHETSDPNLLTMVFDYDWMEMVDIGSIGADGTEYAKGKFDTVQAPGITGAPSDITSNKKAGAGKNPAGGGAGKSNKFADFIGGAANKGVKQFTTDAVTRGVTMIAGNGRFGKALGGRISEGVNSGIAGFSERLSTTSQASARDAAAGSFSGGATALTSPVSDSATAGSDTAKAVVLSTGGAY